MAQSTSSASPPTAESSSAHMDPTQVLNVFPEVMDALKKVDVLEYEEPFMWNKFNVTMVPSPSQLQEKWLEARGDEVVRFDTTMDNVDGRLWLSHGEHTVKRYHDYVMESMPPRIDIYICPLLFKEHGVKEAAHGWYDEHSWEHCEALLSSPSISFAKDLDLFAIAGDHRRVPVTTGCGAERHLAVAATQFALHACGKKLQRVVTTEALHGFGIRAAADLIVETDAGFVAVEFFAQAKHNFRKAKLGDAPPFFPEKVFQNIRCAATLGCEGALTVCYSFQASKIYYQFDMVDSAFTSLAADLVAVWHPDGHERFKQFQALARETMPLRSCEVLLAQLPKDVCKDPFCLAGVRCIKRKHLYEVRDAPPCNHFFSRGRCKHGAQCRNHHGGDVVMFNADAEHTAFSAGGPAANKKKKASAPKKAAAKAATTAAALSADATEPSVFDQIMSMLQPKFG